VIDPQIDAVITGASVRDLQVYCWKHGDLSYKLDSLQLSIRKILNTSPSKKVCILSSRQIGKSFFSVIYALEYLIRNKKKIARIVAPTLKQCNDIVQDNLMPIMRDSPENFMHQKRSEYRWDLANGSSLRLGALERAHVDGNRGGNASLIIYEECGFVSQEDFLYGVNSVLGPQLLRSAGREIYVSSPSEDPDHPLHTQVLPSCEAEGTAFRYTVNDSPSITPDQIEEAKRRCGGEDTDAYKREYLAQIIRPSSLVVIPPYDEKVHVREYDLPLHFYSHITMDGGGVRDKTVALYHLYDYRTDIDLILDEIYWDANTTTDVIVRDLKAFAAKWPAVQSTYADVNGQAAVDMTALGFGFALPQKSDWQSTVQSMVVRFSTAKIWIHPRCEFLRRSCRGAIFNKNRTDFERLPELGHCDAVAALMYALRMQNRENPYPAVPQNVMQVAANRDEITFANTVSPKRFGAFR
jgi:hypothetical protein